MASPRRLLYADGNITSGGNLNLDGNITIECIANCIGVCIYSVCFPSPPLSPGPLPFNNVSSTINLHSRNQILPTLIITATSAVVGSFFLLLALYAYFRFLRGCRSRLSADAADADDDDLVPGGEIEHRMWYIRTQGLDESSISSIASLVYKSGDGLVDGRDCSVCLGEFHEGELVRLLPKCSHAFHLPCIDRWLRSHVNCPLCRAPVVCPSGSPASPLNAVSSEQAGPETGSSVPAENNQIEANRQRMEIGIQIQLSEGSSSRASTSELRRNLPMEEKGLQPIRRSFSMDSFSLDVLVREGRKEGELLREEEEQDSANREKPVGYLKGNLRLKQPAIMERSLSSQSARWFFSRYGPSRNSVLPL